jgi:hypothetical protein
LKIPIQMYTFFSFFLQSGIWTQGLHFEPLQPFSVMSSFEIRSHKLFSEAVFELGSSWSQPPEYLGLQGWAIGTRHQINTWIYIYYLDSPWIHVAQASWRLTLLLIHFC